MTLFSLREPSKRWLFSFIYLHGAFILPSSAEVYDATVIH